MRAAERRRIRGGFASERILRLTIITPIILVSFVAGVGASLFAGKTNGGPIARGAAAQAPDAAPVQSTVTIIDNRSLGATAIEPAPAPQTAVKQAGGGKDAAGSAASVGLEETASIAKPAIANREAAAPVRSAPPAHDAAATQEPRAERTARTPGVDSAKEQPQIQPPPAEAPISTAVIEPQAATQSSNEPAPVKAPVEEAIAPKAVEAIADVPRAVAEPVAAEANAKQANAIADPPKPSTETAASGQTATQDAADTDATAKDDGSGKPKRNLFGRVLGFMRIGGD